MSIKLSFTGDLMALIPENKAANKDGRYDYYPVFDKIAPTLRDSDYVVGNLETPVANEDLRWTYEPTIFNTPPAFAEAAVNAGFNCFSLSNNHCLDRGIEGLNQSLDNLRKLDVDFLGVYDNIEDSRKPLIKQIGDKKFAFLSFTYGTNSEWRNNKLAEQDRFRVDLIREQNDFNNIKVNKKVQTVKDKIKKFIPQPILEKMIPLVIPECVRNEKELIKDSYNYKHLSEKIKKAKEEADFVIMLLHSGGQYNNEVGDYTRNVCKSMIEMGCDLIVTNHPHCVLSYEYFNDKLVLYALGNFCFTPGYGYFYKGVYADYSLIFNLYVDDGNPSEWKKSVTVCKSVKERSGHSVTYPVFDLINEASGKKRQKLIDDNAAVLKRFFGSKASNYQTPEAEYFF